ncbi:MAG: hypothetical protein NTW29_08315 [Bacteroidetes bacterium]|nr:hypothetical protein [Bacteroidota bacterium]
MEISTELPSLWASSDYSNKQKLQNLIFTEGTCYNKKKDESRTTKINSIFLQIARLKRLSGENKKGLQAEKPLKSIWVVPEKLVSNKIIQFFERMHMIMKVDFSML